MLREFRAFLLRGNVVDLAIGVVMGVAFGSVVNAMVKDLITPLVGAIGGKADFSGLFFTINNSRFLYGEFINAMVSFVIIGTAVFFLVVVPMNKLMSLSRRQPPADPTSKKCAECLSEIPIDARRCAFCTSPQPAG